MTSKVVDKEFYGITEKRIIAEKGISDRSRYPEFGRFVGGSFLSLAM
jgi:hypothetical protein